METGNQRLFLGLALSLSSLFAMAEPTTVGQQVIEADVERREISRDAIDSENFELGAWAGAISIQDFNTAPVYGLRAAWHVTEDLFFEGAYGTAKADLTSYEKLSGGPPLFSDEERDYSYYNLALGWNIFPGEVFISERFAFKSDFYILGGAGSTEFLGDNWFTITLGAGYRLLLNDTVAFRLDLRDHIYDREAFGIEETTNNLEFSAGITVFF